MDKDKIKLIHKIHLAKNEIKDFKEILELYKKDIDKHNKTIATSYVSEILNQIISDVNIIDNILKGDKDEH
jgi:hypothetical protein